MVPSIPPGKVFGRYRIVKVIGTGGMGTVYEARHTELDRRVALKALPRRFAENPTVLGRFLREGRAVARVEHPHVVAISDVGMEDDIPYLVMEYLEGEPLGALLAREEQLEVRRAIDLLVPVVSAVGAAHVAGIVHRDLKPDNVFLVKTPHGAPHPKVLDFGISKVDTEQGATATGMLLGTPKYMSPEQAVNSKDVSAATDQWSLGVMLYECLAGRRPFEGESLFELLQRISTAEYAQLAEAAPNVPEELARIVEKAMARDAKERFSSMTALGRALLPFASPETAATWASAFAEDAVIATPEKRARSAERTVTGVDDGQALAFERLARGETPPAEAAGDRAESAASPSAPASAARASSRWMLVAGGGAILVAGLGLGWSARSSAPSSTPSAPSGEVAARGSIAPLQSSEPIATPPTPTPIPTLSPTTASTPSASASPASPPPASSMKAARAPVTVAAPTTTIAPPSQPSRAPAASSVPRRYEIE